jgi:ABC-type branched-subunit amino acid transport system ATPase component
MTFQMSSKLSISEISKRFGGITAVKSFSIALPEAAIVGLIGPNGAGKTTVFNLITGLVKIDGGSIRLGTKELHRPCRQLTPPLALRVRGSSRLSIRAGSRGPARGRAS